MIMWLIYVRRKECMCIDLVSRIFPARSRRLSRVRKRRLRLRCGDWEVMHGANPTEKNFLSHAEAAAELSLSKQRIWQLAKEGKLTPGPYMGKKTVTRESVNAFRSKAEDDSDHRTVLEQLFDRISWTRKFDNYVPERSVLHTWHLKNGDEVMDAVKRLPRLKEETEKVCRALFLGADEHGQVLVITEEPWN